MKKTNVIEQDCNDMNPYTYMLVFETDTNYEVNEVLHNIGIDNIKLVNVRDTSDMWDRTFEDCWYDDAERFLEDYNKYKDEENALYAVTSDYKGHMVEWTLMNNTVKFLVETNDPNMECDEIFTANNAKHI